MSDGATNLETDGIPAALAEQINALLDGELSPSAAAALEPVMMQSAAARALLLSLSIQRRALRARFPVSATTAAADALVARFLAIADGKADLEPSSVSP